MNIPKPSAMPGAKKIETDLTDDQKSWGLSALGAGRPDLAEQLIAQHDAALIGASRFEFDESSDEQFACVETPTVIKGSTLMKDTRKKPVIVKDHLTDRPLKNHPELLALHKQLVGTNTQGDI